MTQKNIIQKGEKVLQEKAKEVKIEDIATPHIKNIIQKMSGALKAEENGVGLAAPQIGILFRIFIVSEEIFQKNDGRGTSLKPDEIMKKRREAWNPLTFINPKLLKSSAKKKFLLEGCLSVKGMYGKVKRSEKIFFESFNEKGEKIKRGASGLFAQVVQHELDHLDGILFVEKAVELKKEVNKNG